MTALPVLRVNGNGDGTTHQPREWTTQAYTNIDENIASPDGATILGPLSTAGSTSFLLEDTPGDFDNMDTVSITVRCRTGNRVDDFLTLLSKIVAVDGTLLASGASAGNMQLLSFNGSSTMTTLSPISFPTINTTATKAQWDGAILQLRQGYAVTGGTDAFTSYVVDGVEINGTYTAAVASIDPVRFRTSSDAWVDAASDPKFYTSSGTWV